MGWQGDLTARAFALGLLLQPALGPAQTRSDPNAPRTEPALPEPLPAQDLALIEELDLLLQLELLRDWDPDEELPIPSDAKGASR